MTSSPIFIVGVPRSGTTLVSGFLNSTKKIFIGKETHFFYYRGYYNRDNSLNQLIEGYLNNSIGSIVLDIDIDTKSYLKKSKTLTSFFERLCNIDNKNKIIRWGEKTPDHLLFLDDIFDHFKNATIINVIRDPRDVYLSLKNINWGIQDYLFRLKSFKYSVNLKKHYPNKKIINIRYESLISNQEKTLSKLFDEIDLDFNYHPMQNFEFLNYDEKKEPWKKNNNKPIISDNFNKWKKEKNILNKIHINFISIFCKNEILQMSYEKGVYNKPIINFVWMLCLNLISLMKNISFKFKNTKIEF